MKKKEPFSSENMQNITRNSSAVCKLQAGWIYSMHIKSWNTAAMEHYRVIY
jgi:hypothetical protein